MKKRWKLSNEDIEKILSLFKEGFSQNYIAHQFHVDHSTVYYHLKKTKLLNTAHKISITLRNRKKGITGIDYDGEKINVGKNYEEYLDEEEVKRLKRQEECPHGAQLLTIRCKCCGKMIEDKIVSPSNENHPRNDAVGSLRTVGMHSQESL